MRVADTDTVFAQVLVALQQPHLLQDDAMRIGQPVLVAMGADSPSMRPVFKHALWMAEHLPGSSMDHLVRIALARRDYASLARAAVRLGPTRNTCIERQRR
ncbi:MAG TPA: hypothetical protein VKQ30_21945 [Ktedonobacterales bacterium]|nr:hypothetical protein [Ktedonobacterales bacterium]